MAKPKIPVHLVVGDQSVFLKRRFPHVVKKKIGISFSIAEGGHMFPLEHPVEVGRLVKQLIHA